MKEALTWIGEQSSLTLWLVFAGVCLLLILIPSYRKIVKLLSAFFSFRRAEVVDFSWRHAQDYYLCTLKGKAYYWNPDGKSFVLEGGKILLNWKVVGAFRIDIVEIGSNLSGNSVSVIARKEHNKYTLIAHTLWGKLTHVLEIPQEAYRTIQTVNFSEDGHFRQRSQKLKRKSFLDPVFRGKSLAVKKINSSFTSICRLLLKKNNRIYVKPKWVKQQQFKRWNISERNSLKKIFFFNPRRFDNIKIEQEEKLFDTKF